MLCPYCESYESKVNRKCIVDSKNSIYRRRECLSCHNRYTTYENIHLSKGVNNEKQFASKGKQFREIV